jgi:aminopeptidase YwaD
LEILLNNKKHLFLTAVVIGIGFTSFAQKPRFGEKKIRKNVEKHIVYLASDELTGRATGSAGEQMSAKYIAEQFEKIGLEPKGKDGYHQYMDVATLRMAQSNSTLNLGKDVQTLFTDYYPLSASANNGEYYGDAVNINFGISDGGLNWDDYAGKDVNGKAVMINVSLPDGNHPHSKFLGWSGIEHRVEYAKSKGAKMVLFYATDSKDYPSGKLALTTKHSGIPVFFVKKDLTEKPLIVIHAISDIMLLSSSASNVVGFIDNGSPYTVVVGAHHDHLGHGEISGSLAEKTGDIHNGADDNASGVASLIEIARVVKKKTRRYKNNNYLFVAFTAEEMGLLGSKHFLKETDLAIDFFNYMINMDMVGHLDSSKKTLIINGVGTSPAWNETMDEVKYSSRKIANYKTTESGIGSSDHTSFYLENIPSVHFFTGQHQYYHKPGDDVEIVNMNGTAYVTSYINRWLREMDKKGKVEFTKTKDDTQGRRKFKVTLGIMPDYVYDGEGMRVDGVKDGKPGFNAGLLKGDIISTLNGKPIMNMQDYMGVLSSLNPGDKVPLTIKRDGKVIELEVQF